MTKNGGKTGSGYLARVKSLFGTPRGEQAPAQPLPVPEWIGTNRIFCLSFQRTGTKSLGTFLSRQGFPTASWKMSSRNDWTGKWFDDDLEAIFDSEDFRAHQAFEDAPWFAPGLYKILDERFPEAKFILLQRDPDKWFESMLSHSGGRSPGRTAVHAKLYGLEREYEALRAQAPNAAEVSMYGFDLAERRDHYIEVYLRHGQDVRSHFARSAEGKFFFGRLEDEDKWTKLAGFLGTDPEAVGEDIHVNQSTAEMRGRRHAGMR